MAALMLFSVAAPLFAQSPETQSSRAPAAVAKPSNVEPDAALTEDAQPKRGSVRVAGQTIAYTATPGTLVIRNDADEPVASMFYVAYVADRPKGSAPRPITFAFNGGPGSSSMFLHIGSIGPVRVSIPSTTPLASAPYDFVENEFTMLDRTDLVFLDAIGTGLSRAAGKGKEADFMGVDQDIRAFASGIRRYLTINDRWNSPTFLFGESYGTLRAAGLAYTLGGLAGGGIRVNGVILQGSNLNRALNVAGYDDFFVTILPSYAATAWYHNRLANRPATLEPFLSEVRAWARGPYAAVLAKGYMATAAERQDVARAMSGYTGLSEEFLLQSDLRVDLSPFRKELLRSQGQSVGRLDSRIVGPDVMAAGSEPDFDATSALNAGPFSSGIHRYLFGTLGYRTPLEYRPNNYARMGKWDETHKAPGIPDRLAIANTALDLAQAMRENPHMKVLSLNGYYDLATPFHRAEYDTWHMSLPPALQGNVSFAYFEAGHMIYTNPQVLVSLKATLDRFYDGALPAGRP
jgi:carboxypeptidase C (cathepsin A)